MSKVVIFPDRTEDSQWPIFEKEIGDQMTRMGIPAATARDAMEWLRAKIKPLVEPTPIRISFPVSSSGDVNAIRRAVEEGLVEFGREEQGKRLRLIMRLVGLKLSVDMDRLG